MWIFVCICIIKGNNNQTNEQGEEADAGAATTNEQVEEAAATPAPATDDEGEEADADAAAPATVQTGEGVLAPLSILIPHPAVKLAVSPVSSRSPPPLPRVPQLRSLAWSVVMGPIAQSMPPSTRVKMGLLETTVSATLPTNSSASSMDMEPPPARLSPDHMTMWGKMIRASRGLPEPAPKPRTSTPSPPIYSNTLMPPCLPDFLGDISLDEAGQDDALGRGNATREALSEAALVEEEWLENDMGDGVGLEDIGTGGSTMVAGAGMDQGAGLTNMNGTGQEAGMGQQGVGPSTIGKGLGRSSLDFGMGLGVGQSGCEYRMGQGLAPSTVGVQSSFAPMAGSPLALNNGGGARPALTPQLMGGAAARRHLPFAAAAPQEAAAAAPAMRVNEDAWLSEAYTVPPRAFADTVAHIATRKLFQATVPIEEIFNFVVSLREQYQGIYSPGSKTTLTKQVITNLNNHRLFTLLQDVFTSPTTRGPFTGNQERFLIAAQIICQSKSAGTLLMGFLSGRDSGKIRDKLSKVFHVP